MNTISIPVPGVNTQAYSSPANTVNLPSPADCIDYTARMVYTLCYRLAHGDGYHGRAFVSIPALASMRGVSVSTIDKALFRLRRHTWIHTSRRKTGLLITPLIRLAQRDIVMLEDHRNAPAKDTPFSPPPMTHLLRISNSFAADSYKRKNKSNRNTKKEQETYRETETVPAVSVAVLASPKEEGRETVNEASAVEHSPIPADPESETLEVIAAPPLLLSSPAAVPEPDSDITDIKAQLVAELRREGIEAKRAAELVEKFPPRRVSRSLTYVRRMTENKPPETVGNRAGYIISAITHGYAEGLDMAMVGKSLPPDRMKRREAQKPPSAGVPPYHLPFREEDETPQAPAVWRPSGDMVTPPEKVATPQEVEAIMSPVSRSVRATDADLDRLPPAMAERARRRREQEREGVK